MAKKVVLPSGNVAYVTNTLADGTVRDSMEGYVIPYDEAHIPIVKQLFQICDSIRICQAEREREKLLKELQEENKDVKQELP